MGDSLKLCKHPVSQQTFTYWFLASIDSCLNHIQINFMLLTRTFSWLVLFFLFDNLSNTFFINLLYSKFFFSPEIIASWRKHFFMVYSETRCCCVSSSSHLPFGQVLLFSQNFYWLKPSVCYVRYFCLVLVFLLLVSGFKQKSFLCNDHILQSIHFFKFRPLTTLLLKDFPIFVVVLNHVSKSVICFTYPPFLYLSQFSFWKSPSSSYLIYLYLCIYVFGSTY